MRAWLLAFALSLSALPAFAAGLPPKEEVARYAQAFLDEHYAADAPGVAVLVARGDEVLYRGARGSASLELGVPLSPDQVFRLGSVTKQFSAAAVLRLAEQGKLSLDDPLTRFVPGYPGGDAISVRMLLNHTSGLPGSDQWFYGPDKAKTPDFSETVRRYGILVAPAGDLYRYSNRGYGVMSHLMSRVTAES